MSATICPTVTVDCFEDFQEQIERIASFAVRLHIDIADGSLTANKLIPVDQVWWPGGVRADIHVMSSDPGQYLEHMIALGPQMVIVHAEARGNFNAIATALHKHGIQAGVALQQSTPVSYIESALGLIDHVLIFSGKLGRNGGEADMSLLTKAAELKRLRPQIEIGWDGGVNDSNIQALVEGGIEVLNVGGYISKSPDPKAAYATLEHEIQAHVPQG